MIKTEIIKVKLKCCKCSPRHRTVQFHSDVIEYHYKFVKTSLMKRLFPKFVIMSN